MKKLNLKYGLLIVLITPFLAGCPKPKPNPVPEQDKELQSSIDASFATQAITDIDMICSFVGENELHPKFYMPEPGSSLTNSFTSTNDVAAKYLIASFNKTKCLDGHLREGSIFMNYNNSQPNARYYRDYEFQGQITLSEYKVDGWLITTVGGNPCMVYNLLPGANYSADETKLSWLIEGSFEFTHPTDPSKNMTWNGKIIKTLANSADRNVFASSHQSAINWPLARVEYKGDISGTTADNVPFTMVLNESAPLTRDFSCFPDKIGGVETSPVFRSWTREFHPFTSGIATFNTGMKYPRQIYFGNEGSPDLAPQCDNSGEVLIKGVSYRVDFMK